MMWPQILAISALLTAFAPFPLHAMLWSDKGSCDADDQKANFAQGSRAIRVLEDPVSHQRWLVEQNLAHPEGPARAVPMTQRASSGNHLDLPSGHVDNHRGSDSSAAVVHAGEPLLIVEETPASRAELAAVALNNGRRGEMILARLQFSGKVVTAVVVASVRAKLTVPRIERER